MQLFNHQSSVRLQGLKTGFFALALSQCACAANAQSAYVRVNQVGYEASAPSARAYLMSTASEAGALFQVVNDEGQVAYRGKAGALLGTWANSKKLTYQVRTQLLHHCLRTGAGEFAPLCG
jgi:Cellulase N-terminal ig-like domain